MVLKIIQGNLFSQEVECFVNPWNLNFIPWFLLLTHGVSGQLKKIAGYKPFNEILKKGILKPGQAVLTSGGKIPQKIIHVAGLKWYWTTDLNIVEKCTRNALILAKKENIKSIAFPLIGAGVGGLDETQVLQVMEKVCNEKEWDIDIKLIKYSG
jgi:O-acetyl-ADP-ribose deacetylase